MALPPQLNIIPRLYHFTDDSNIQTILSMGGLFATVHLKGFGASFRPGGNELSLDLDQSRGLSSFVHLCFRDNHPMEFTARNEGRIARTAWIRINRAVLDLPGVMYCPVVSNANDAKLIPIAEAATLIDYQGLYQFLDWKTPEGQQRRRSAELCEVLVPDYIPLDYLEIPSHG